MSSSSRKAHKWSLGGEKWARAAACQSYGLHRAAECHWWSALSLLDCTNSPIPSAVLASHSWIALTHCTLRLQETDCKTVIAQHMNSATGWFWGQQIPRINPLWRSLILWKIGETVTVCCLTAAWNTWDHLGYIFAWRRNRWQTDFFIIYFQLASSNHVQVFSPMNMSHMTPKHFSSHEHCSVLLLVCFAWAGEKVVTQTTNCDHRKSRKSITLPCCHKSTYLGLCSTCSVWNLIIYACSYYTLESI